MAITESELTALYESELGRTSPDKAGMDYWMQSGLTPEQIRANFAAVATQPGAVEAAREADREVEITNLYLTEFGRTQVDDPGLEYWVGSDWETEQIGRHFDQLIEGQYFNEGRIVWDEDPTDRLLRLKHDPLGEVTTGEGTVGATWWLKDEETAIPEGFDILGDIKQTFGKGDVFGSTGQVGGTRDEIGVDQSYDFSGVPGMDVVGGYPSLNIDWTPGTKIADWDVGGPTIYGQVQRLDMLKFVADTYEEDPDYWANIDTTTNVGTVVADYLDTGYGFTEFREELPGGEYFESETPSPRREQWQQGQEELARSGRRVPTTTRGRAGVVSPAAFAARETGVQQRKSGFRRRATRAQI